MGQLNQDFPQVQEDLDNIEQMAITGLSGFNRLASDTKIRGIIQFCYDASSQEVHQIDEDGDYTLLETQTTFADGSTALADRTIAIYHVSGETSFKYWYQGTEVEVTGIKTVQMADDGGGYVYFNSAGNLTYNGGSAFTYIVKETLIAFATWNTTDDQLIWFADERHGISMNPVTHLYEHSTVGFAWGRMGTDITGLVNNGTTFTAVTAGAWADEDLEHIIAELSTAPFLYKEGLDGQWVMTTANNELGHKPAGNLVWNNEDAGGAGDWGLTLVGNNTNCVIMTFWATNNALAPVVRSIGQKEFTSRSTARDELESAVHKVQLDGLPSPEMNPIGSMIIRHTTNGEIEEGANGEIWIDHRWGTPNGRFE